MAERFTEMKVRGERIAALTCYDSSFARAVSAAGIDLLLVGDSLGMVVQGAPDTSSVSLSDVEYHLRCVTAAQVRCFVLADMPLAALSGGDGQLVESATRLLFAGAEMVKIEGGAEAAGRIARVIEEGMPVCGHIGLQPQTPGEGPMRKGVDDEGIRRLVDDAVALEQAGVSALVLEMVSVEAAAAVAGATRVPTIGIGSGPGCDGQILVMHDVLGIVPAGRDRSYRFAKDFLAGAGSVEGAFRSYRDAVKGGSFPAPEHSFSRA